MSIEINLILSDDTVSALKNNLLTRKLCDTHGGIGDEFIYLLLSSIENKESEIKIELVK